MHKSTVVKGLILLLLAFILGAFGTHYLESILHNKELNSFKTGVRYQFYAGFLLLILGLNSDKLKVNKILPFNLLFIGSCLFSFSIYILSLSHRNDLVNYLWPLTPLGGILMLISLLILTYKSLKIKEENHKL